ncbi:MAG: NCS2 family permease [Candidatus Gastranaerophilales bacterium]|nr:NCS2 family permease [Candidatus Gastranaerophilales bacterium]
MKILEQIFKIKENNSTIKTELTAGLTTFFTMSYLFILSPKLLENAGLEFTSSITVTALVVFICSILMAFIANKPYAAAPFLGETAFISYTVVNTLGFSIKTALAAIALCGVILFIMTLTNSRAYIADKIPENIKISFCCGLGLFFIFIALRDMGIVNFTAKNIPLEIGNFTQISVILGLFCFILLISLAKKGLSSAVIISMAVTTILGIIFKDIQFPQHIVSTPYGITSSLFQTDFTGLLNKNFIPVLFVIFILVNIDTTGAIIGLSYKTDEEKNTNNKKAMLADSMSVIIAPLMGTTTPGAYLDSMTGISAGGKTGLTAAIVGILFLFGLIFTPIIMIIPSYAYAPALLYVGILMTTIITKIDFNDITETAPFIISICIMIFTYNIGAGIMAAFIIYPLIQLLCRQKSKTNIISWIMFVLSIIFFTIYPY